ncbi:MAG: pyruvate kinase [Sulfuricurvum sp.]|nr:pyruvate kinase [Sulfuricurvum sp.]
MTKRTKILATIGPSSQSVEILSSMIRAGVNVFRLNFSHGTHDYHLKVLKNIRTAMEQTGLIVGILQDISGPKIRIGMLKEDFHLQAGDFIDFYRETVEGERIDENHYISCLNTNDILSRLRVGDAISLHDGSIRAKIVACEEEYIRIIIENKGKLSSKKGVNFPNTHLDINVLTPKDHADMAWGVTNGVDFMAISFVQNAQDMIQAREVIRSYNGNVQLIAKIEKFDAIENIDEILEHSDGLMVARGDLGIEVPYHEVPMIQKMLIRKANERSKPVITATQMLLSMTEKDTATRAEISDVANAVLDGTDAVMLSEESSVGHNPVLVVETMVKTIESIEKIYPFDKFSEFKHYDPMDIVNESAVRLGDALHVAGIIAMTTSGQSVKKLSRYRPEMTIYAATYDERIARILTIIWGVAPTFLTKARKVEDALREIIIQGLERQILDKTQTYIFTAGDPVWIQGTTNLIRILGENELHFFGESKTNRIKGKKREEIPPTLF